MKKYQAPEIDIVNLLYTQCILEESGQGGMGGNENMTFDEESNVATDLNSSANLWDE